MAITANDSKSREKVYGAIFQGPDNATDAAIVAASMPDTTKSVAVYDGGGNIIGYVALYATAALT